MSDTSHSDNRFAKVFIPGLVLGLIVGMAIGAFAPLLLLRDQSLPQQSGIHTGQPAGPRDRELPPGDAQPQTPATQQPASGVQSDPKADPKTQPKPIDKPVQPAPGTPPNTDKPKN